MFIIGKLRDYDKAFPAIGQEKKSPKLTNLWLLKSYREQGGENGQLVCGKMKKNNVIAYFVETYSRFSCLIKSGKNCRKLQKNGKKMVKNGRNCKKVRKNARFLSKN